MKPGGDIDCLDSDPNPKQETPIVVTIEEPTFRIVKVGETVTLVCRGRSETPTQIPLDITWTAETSSSRRTQPHSSSVWSLDNVQVEDSGKYTCFVSDGVHTSSLSIVINVE